MIQRLFITALIALSLGIFFTEPASANTFLTGTAQNERIGVIQFDNIPGLAPQFQARITRTCDALGCFLKGFIWSPTVGWIALDGEFIAGVNLPQTNPNYPPSMYPRAAMGNGALSGYAWSEHGGWIMLNSDPSRIIQPINQTATSFGAYLDLQGALDPTLGYRFRGFAWSERLGWIKFGREANDPAATPDFAVYANWVPDAQPPALQAWDRTWFGVNNPTGTIVWSDFASDNAGIDLVGGGTAFNLVSDVPACQPAVQTASVTPSASPGSGGLTIDLTITGLGSLPIGNPFCRYFLWGTITDMAGNVFRIYDVVPSPAPPNPASYSSRISFYVKAGNYSPTNSSLSFQNATGAIADGVDAAVVTLPLRDIANNPIVDILADAAYTGSPARTVDVMMQFNNTLRFDTRQGMPNTSSVWLQNGPPPALPLAFGAQTFGPVAPLVNGIYRLDVRSLAPTTSSATPAAQLDLNTIALTITDQEFRPGQGGGTQNAAITPPTTQIAFSPAVTVSGATVSSGGLTGVVTIGSPARLSYTLNNFSTLPLSNADFDHEFIISSGTTTGAVFLETQKIQDANPEQSERAFGWSDPIAGQTRYELYAGDLLPGTSLNGANSIFRNAYVTRIDPNTPSPIRTDGIYDIDCLWGIPTAFTLSNTGACPPTIFGSIDRSDRSSRLNLSGATLNTGTGLRTPTTSTVEIDFTVEKIIPVPIAQADIQIQQHSAYRFDNPALLTPEFTIYQRPLITTTPLSSIGVDYSGVAAGRSIFDAAGRQGQAFQEIDLQALNTLMRRNVASLTRNLNGNCFSSAGVVITLPLSGLQLPTQGACIREQNNEVVVFYEDNNPNPSHPLQTLRIQGPNLTDTLRVPADKRYTLIVKGANLYLKNNLLYGNANSSFGIILLADDNGLGGNLYLDPNPTNLVGMVYGEGSLMSYDDTNPADPFFYGPLSANPQRLANQLLWQGSIVSKNTIGGAARSVIPAGLSCPNLSTLNCAQRYDLDFIRRFTVSADPTRTWSWQIANNALFSGGGSCNASTRTCTQGPLQLTTPPLRTPPLVQLTATTVTLPNVIDLANSHLDPFYIDQDLRRITANPPPGFSAASDQEFNQVVR